MMILVVSAGILLPMVFLIHKLIGRDYTKA